MSTLASREIEAGGKGRAERWWGKKGARCEVVGKKGCGVRGGGVKRGAG